MKKILLNRIEFHCYPKTTKNISKNDTFGFVFTKPGPWASSATFAPILSYSPEIENVAAEFSQNKQIWGLCSVHEKRAKLSVSIAWYAGLPKIADAALTPNMHVCEEQGHYLVIFINNFDH